MRVNLQFKMETFYWESEFSDVDTESRECDTEEMEMRKKKEEDTGR